MLKNEYLPKLAEILDIKQETEDVRTYTLNYKTDYKPGQFFIVSLYGHGEAPFTAVTSSDDKFQLTIRNVGKLTSEIFKLKQGDEIGIRGPYGNYFNVGKNKDILFIAGGCGMAPLRSMIHHVIKNRKDYGKVHVLYGSRDETQIIYQEEVKDEWLKYNVDSFVCVDFKKGKSKWPEHVCLVTELMDKKLSKIDLKNTVALLCGPSIMMKFVIEKLLGLGVSEEKIIASLERNMKCGFGKCGHCYLNEKYVCTDGPIFSYKEMKELGLE